MRHRSFDRVDQSKGPKIFKMAIMADRDRWRRPFEFILENATSTLCTREVIIWRRKRSRKTPEQILHVCPSQLFSQRWLCWIRLWKKFSTKFSELTLMSCRQYSCKRLAWCFCVIYSEKHRKSTEFGHSNCSLSKQIQRTLWTCRFRHSVI